eukprot:jgi/Mesen1/10592/ME000085S09924
MTEAWECNGVGYAAMRDYLLLQQPKRRPQFAVYSSPALGAGAQQEQDQEEEEEEQGQGQEQGQEQAQQEEDLAAPSQEAAAKPFIISLPVIKPSSPSSTPSPSPSPSSASASGRPQASPAGTPSVGRALSARSAAGEDGESASASSSGRRLSAPAGNIDLGFTGVHCTFDCNASVEKVKFSRTRSDTLAFGATDGTLQICYVGDTPRVVHELKGHTKAISDFEWSLGDDYLCSASQDKSVRVWDAGAGVCIRFIYFPAPLLCIRFHPLNNNWLLVSNASDELTARSLPLFLSLVVNFSTGRVLHRLAMEASVTALEMHPGGSTLFAGDALGSIHSVSMDPHLGTLKHAHRCHAGLTRASPVTAVQFRPLSRLAGGPVLLAAARDGSLRFFSVALEMGGYLFLKASLPLAPRAHAIRAAFCPCMSLDGGEIVVSGHDDHHIYFYDFTKPKAPCVSKMQACPYLHPTHPTPPHPTSALPFLRVWKGHDAPVVDLCWNDTETLLASSDCDGHVIVWAHSHESPALLAASASASTTPR